MVDYHEYLKSPEWRAVRQKYLDSRLSSDCQGCGASWRPDFEFHHRTYKNLGRERLMDLVPLCRSCHQAVHDLFNSDQKWKNKGLWYATREVTRRRVRRGV